VNHWKHRIAVETSLDRFWAKGIGNKESGRYNSIESLTLDVRTVDLSSGFDYREYDRTIIAFHGTTVEAADALLAGPDFIGSESVDDWLGSGIYFWEYAPKQAWWWARKFKKWENPAVVGAKIRLGNCFDLLDPANIAVLKVMKNQLVKVLEESSVEVPKNVRHHRNLDCAVFNFLYARATIRGTLIDSSRAVYVPTDSKKRIWKGSWIYDAAHIQICVRNPKNILEVWRVQEADHEEPQEKAGG